MRMASPFFIAILKCIGVVKVNATIRLDEVLMAKAIRFSYKNRFEFAQSHLHSAR